MGGSLHPENVFGGSFDISLAATYIAGSIPTEFVNRMYGDSIVSGACIPGDTQTTTTILPQEQHQTRLLLLRALLGETNDVVDRDAAAFRAGVCLPQKMSIILMFPGHARYSHQVNILRARQTAPTRAQLAVIIAREVLRFLTTAREGGAPLQFGGSAVELQDLVLMEVHHVSKSSLQPVIGLAHQRDILRDIHALGYFGTLNVCLDLTSTVDVTSSASKSSTPSQPPYLNFDNCNNNSYAGTECAEMAELGAGKCIHRL
ncbi:uncharacterized protein TRAVEDRAFT_17340 [Trametes versicolor FP-101664 SS1]|uniref:uncharacterized protein n=1 Tax=Trametes versicolor (strain FP-101664) TaxID=717944 RepID=UPI00046238D9|nr:uncharacterized protein TRAVEDRAFT_17340 [Trametes versicolor FP-101664 SS1]EIW62775.1 hypothetical protein TRAVEDRAFT_17340 [Trametes versicolor FP-101664 SS1]